MCFVQTAVTKPLDLDKRRKESVCNIFSYRSWFLEHRAGESEKAAQSCPTLCDPMDYTVYGILQARILEWVAVPSLEDLPNPGIELRSAELQVDSLPE